MPAEEPVPTRPWKSNSTPASNAGANHEGEELALLDILIIFAKRKRSILLIAVMFVIVATVASFMLTKKYTSTVTFLVPVQDPSWAAALRSQLGNPSGTEALKGPASGLKNPVDFYVGILKSLTVEDAIVKRFGLITEYHERYLSNARRTFEQQVMVDGGGQDGLIRISVEDANPVRAAAMANAYVDQLRTFSQHFSTVAASQRRLIFEQQLALAESKLDDAEHILQSEQRTGLIQLNSQAQELIESAAELRAQITEKEVQILALKSYAADENPELILAQTELRGLRAQLKALGDDSSNSSDSLLVSHGEMPQASLEYVRKLREVKYYEATSNLLARQLELAKIDEAKQGAQIQVVDYAAPPDKPSSRQPIEIVIGAAIAGILAGASWAIAAYWSERLNFDDAFHAKLLYLGRVLRRGFTWKARSTI